MADNRNRSFLSLSYNRISFAGGIFASIIFITLLLMLFIVWLGGGTNPYFGLVVFLVLPPFLFLGILMIPLGMWWEWRRWKRTGQRTESLFPTLDLNIKRHRRDLAASIITAFVLLLLSAIGSYNAYHFTESIEFCGKLCHEVMDPEYTAYMRSPHARVGCTDCHVGAGASFFVKAKVTGLYQVYATLADVYPRPIPVPIKNLRPAQETCEQCHWPDAFFGAKQRLMTYYLSDEKNSPWQVNMLIKIGGGSPGTAQTTGIHWHMNIASEVDYIARDPRREDIPWVKITNHKTGVVSIYEDVDNPLTPEEIKAAAKHRMDCMDCHNRPTHIFRSPSYSVNLALLTERIDPTLPNIKQNGVEVLTADYKSTAEALKMIEQQMWILYDAEKYPDTAISSATIEQAIERLKEIYTSNFFPEMGVSWDNYVDNIGHLDTQGCDRCHAGNHKSEDGKVITRECIACHNIISQGPPEAMEVADSPEGLRFRHPVDIEEAWTEIGCYECHTGANP